MTLVGGCSVEDQSVFNGAGQTYTITYSPANNTVSIHRSEAVEHVLVKDKADHVHSSQGTINESGHRRYVHKSETQKLTVAIIADAMHNYYCRRDFLLSC